MPTPDPTKGQQELANEVMQLLSRLALDPDAIIQEEEPEACIKYLEFAKDRIIRSAVMFAYLLMDEHVSALICRYFFGQDRPFPELRQTEPFRTFNQFVLEKLSFLHKLTLVQNIHDIPGWVSEDLNKLNTLRNGIAHSLFPEYRRQQPEWNGQSVFTTEGFDRFLEDMQKLEDFYGERLRSALP